MSVRCGAWSDMSDKSDLSDIIGAPPPASKALAVDKPPSTGKRSDCA